MILNIIRAEFLKYKRFYVIKILFFISLIIAGLLFYYIMPQAFNHQEMMLYRYTTMFSGYLLVMSYLADYFLKNDSNKWNILLSKNIRYKYVIRKIITIAYFAFIGLIIFYIFISLALNEINPILFNISAIIQLFFINFLLLIPFIILISVISSFSKIFLSTTISLILLLFLPFFIFIYGSLMSSTGTFPKPIVIKTYEYSIIANMFNPTKLWTSQFSNFQTLQANEYFNNKTKEILNKDCTNQVNKRIKEIIREKKREETSEYKSPEYIESLDKELKQIKKDGVKKCMNSKTSELVYLYNGFDIKKYFTSNKNNTFFYLWLIYSILFLLLGAYLMKRKEKN